MDRGTFDFAFDKKTSFAVARWNDNAVVTVASNHNGIYPLANTKRYSRKERKDITISQPLMVAQYTKFMGGVDSHDNGIGNYRIKVRGKKWWWPLFTNAIDSVIVNSWKLYRLVNHDKISQIDFRSYLVLLLIKSEEIKIPQCIAEIRGDNVPSPSLATKGRPSKNSLPENIRLDKVGHVISEHANKARRRCKLCKNHTIFLCIKCKVHLHSKCFKEFHSPQRK